jgi:hypothetical protein
MSYPLFPFSRRIFQQFASAGSIDLVAHNVVKISPCRWQFRPSSLFLMQASCKGIFISFHRFLECSNFFHLHCSSLIFDTHANNGSRTSHINCGWHLLQQNESYLLPAACFQYSTSTASASKGGPFVLQSFLVTVSEGLKSSED